MSDVEIKIAEHYVKMLESRVTELGDAVVERNEEIRLLQIRLARTVSAAYHSLLEMSAWMGIPEHKRQRQIEIHMDNVRYCAQYNVFEDTEKPDAK
jgi:vacuolar-type H+-ATPase subunit D/Vma8